MKIKVEKKHIENAIRKDSHHCMIADAIKSRIPSAQYILVDLQSIRFSDCDTKERYTFFTPPLAQQKLLAFDKGKKFPEFSFHLNTPIKIQKMGWQAQNNRKAKNRKGKKYNKTDKKRKYTMRKEREFGIRIYTETK